MARRVFLSFLGTSNYKPINYYLGDQDLSSSHSVEVRFIQQMLLSHYKDLLSKNDCIYICTTTEAKKKNWLDFGHDPINLENQTGLENTLSFLNLPTPPQAIDIPDGHTEDELWTIFRIIYSLLEDGDEVIFDVTHSFRALPMLNLVLINYARTIKKVKLTAIHYGAYEARTNLGAPVWNLVSLVNLLDWTNAADSFIKHGNAKSIFELVKSSNLTNLFDTGKQQSRAHEKLKEFAKNLLKFTQNVATNRGLSIVVNNELDALRSSLSTIRQMDAIAPLTGLLDEIEKRTIDFRKNSVLNGFAAVMWCIDNGLTQQGITMLQEFILTYILDSLNMDFREKSHRSLLSSVLSVKESDFKLDKKNGPEEIQLAIANLLYHAPVVIRSRELYRILNNEYRNDINHAGIGRKQPKSSEEFEKILIASMQEMNLILSEFPI